MANPTPPHFETARRFLAAIDFEGRGETYPFQWQTFPDNRKLEPSQSTKTLIRTPFGSLADTWPTLCNVNAQGAGVHVKVNETDGAGRSDEHVVSPRAVFLDFDNGDSDARGTGCVPVSMIVRSVRGPHVYWLLERNQDLKQWHLVQRALCHRFGADTNATNLSQAMRVPGFAHWKTGTAISLTLDSEIYFPDRRFSLSELIAGFHLEKECEHLAEEDLRDERKADELRHSPPSKPIAEYTDKLDRARRCIDRYSGQGEGNRNDFLAKSVAPVGWHLGIEIDVWLAECRVWNRRNNPPLGDDEVEATVRACWRRGDRGKLGPYGAWLDSRPDTTRNRRSNDSQERNPGALGSDAKSNNSAAAERMAPTISLLDLEYLETTATPSMPDGHPLTLRGNTGRFISTNGEIVRYCPPLDTWFCWNGLYWMRDSYGAVFNLAQQTVARIHQLFKHPLIQESATPPTTDEAVREEARKAEVRAAITKHVVRHEDPFSIKKLLDYAKWQQRLVVRPEDLDSDDFFLNTPSGVVDIRDKSLLEHAPGRYQSKITTTKYRPNATCPKWMEFLRWAMRGDENLVGFLQRAVGYSFTGSSKEQVFFVCFGQGGNGKSTFMTTLLEIANTYARTCSFSMFLSGDQQKDTGPNEELLALKDIRLAAASEPELGRALRENMIKQVTGGEPMTARPLWGKPVVFVPKFSLWFSCNHRPAIRGGDDGIWRRVTLIPWEAKITPENKDVDLARKLVAEEEGILRWVVDGANQWYHQGLQVPDAVRAATNEYRGDMDVLGTFVKECCMLGPTYGIASRALYRAYEEWCSRDGLQAIKQKTFSIRLKEMGFRLNRVTAGSVFLGIKLREAE